MYGTFTAFPQGTSSDEQERQRVYQRHSTRRASLISEARQELKMFRWVWGGVQYLCESEICNGTRNPAK